MRLFSFAFFSACLGAATCVTPLWAKGPGDVDQDPHALYNPRTERKIRPFLQYARNANCYLSVESQNEQICVRYAKNTSAHEKRPQFSIKTKAMEELEDTDVEEEHRLPDLRPHLSIDMLFESLEVSFNVLAKKDWSSRPTIYRLTWIEHLSEKAGGARTIFPPLDSTKLTHLVIYPASRWDHSCQPPPSLTYMPHLILPSLRHVAYEGWQHGIFSFPSFHPACFQPSVGFASTIAPLALSASFLKTQGTIKLRYPPQLAFAGSDVGRDQFLKDDFHKQYPHVHFVPNTSPMEDGKEIESSSYMQDFGFFYEGQHSPWHAQPSSPATLPFQILWAKHSFSRDNQKQRETEQGGTKQGDGTQNNTPPEAASRPSNGALGLTDLPSDLVCQIARFLPAQDQKHLSQTCRFLRTTLLGDPCIDFRLFALGWGVEIPEAYYNASAIWRLDVPYMTLGGYKEGLTIVTVCLHHLKGTLVETQTLWMSYEKSVYKPKQRRRRKQENVSPPCHVPAYWVTLHTDSSGKLDSELLKAGPIYGKPSPQPDSTTLAAEFIPIINSRLERLWLRRLEELFGDRPEVLRRMHTPQTPPVETPIIGPTQNLAPHTDKEGST
ncbi:F-box domain-containing protein [bacterium NHP-B]|nr:F-box domain-containing protein [bacterium NHP-B]